MPRQPFRPTEQDLRQVRSMAAFGCRQDDIAKLLNVTPKTLRKHFRRELDCGEIEANAKVAETLYKMATSGNNTAASVFWAKSRCGWSDKKPSSGFDGAPRLLPPFILRIDSEVRVS